MGDTEELGNVPDAETAQKLVKEFEGITNTDEAFSQFCLQENDWNLQKALNGYFSMKMREVEQNREEEESERQETVAKRGASIEEGLRQGLLTTEAPNRLTVVSWNIDGLDEKNLKKRTKGVCKILEEEKADIVFLQEVIPETFSYIESKLSEYECISGGGNGEYFVATLLRWGRVYKDRSRIIPFTGSLMGRNVLHTEAHCGKVKLDLLNTHLESTKEHAAQRKIQLQHCFDIINKIPCERNVLFGGDLNMRDKELVEVGGLPASTRDCWEVCGSRKEVQYTWDLTRNTNLEFPGKFKPKCRFDRLYLRSSSSYGSLARHFGLVGLQKIHGTQSFPSDHWGLHLKLHLDQNTSAAQKRKHEDE